MQMTQKEYDSLELDLKNIQEQLTQNQKELKIINSAVATAKAQGDLSENAEYDSALQNQSIVQDTIKNLNISIAEIKDKLANAVIVESIIEDGIIRIGDIVKLQMSGIDNIPELETGTNWKLVSTVLSGKPLVPENENDTGQLLSTTIVAKEILNKKWNGQPLTFSYYDKNNKQRVITILDVKHA